MVVVYLLLVLLVWRLVSLLISSLPLRYPKVKLKPDNLVIYFGGPGSGKTTYAAFLCRRYLANNIPVYSNVPIKGAYKITKDQIGKYRIGPGLLIIDEAGLEYNNREFANNFSGKNKDQKNALEFYKKHRHELVEVAIFSQGFDDMDIKLRTLANELYVVRKFPILPFVYRKRIRKKPDIDEITHQPIDMYEFMPMGFSMVWAPSVWKYFDSFDNMGLPDHEWTKYGEENIVPIEDKQEGPVKGFSS